MINEEQICEFLKKQVPEISKDFQGHGSKSCIAGLKSLTRYTAHLKEKETEERARKSFTLAEQLVNRGSMRVKSVLTLQFIMNIYPMLKPETVKAKLLKPCYTDIY